ncbi:MAG TPA: methyltransferase domain-containing protein [Candidatus Limnocylindrales bacterium]|nr:methyltransferase domain-containing protein [Candidatus Limnocylindrales bacterium]
MPDWWPELYLKFSDQRGRPAADLIAQVRLENPARVIDLGCGTGSSTEQVHRRWPLADITGLDSSEEMLAQAQKAHPDWNWVRSYIERWQPEAPYDLVFSNAAFHWVPDHGILFPRLFSGVAPGGALAVQMPNNFDSPVHQAMKKVAADPRWRGALNGGSQRYGIEPAAFYYDLLRKSAGQLDIWETEYLQVMNGPMAILDWIRGTGMRFYLERLPYDDQRRTFEDLCMAEFETLYRPNDQGKVLFPFKRMFMIAYR